VPEEAAAEQEDLDVAVVHEGYRHGRAVGHHSGLQVER
jgi:hypothetical protein